jgi:integrase
MGVFKRKNKGGEEGETWYVDYYDPTDKRIIKAIGPKKREAEDYLGKVKAAIRENRFFDIKKESKITFDELLDAYIEKIKEQRFYKNYLRYLVEEKLKDKNLTDHQEQKSVSKSKPILREYFGKMLLSEINYKTLENFWDKRKKTPTQHEGERSNRTVNIEMEFLRRIFNKAVKWEMLERNPFDVGEDLFYKDTIKRERVLTEEEVKRLIDACPGYLKSIVITAIYTGLRKGDILNLRWKDVDLERGLIRLLEQKTGKTRNIVLNSDMKSLLQNLPVKGECVFPNKHRKPFTDIKRSFQTALKDAGIEQRKDRREKIVFHTLRHTCINLLTEKGADTTMVKNYVAHASEEMTERYTHLSEEYARRTAEILNGLCGVNQVYGNKMETITNRPQNPPDASA